MAIIHICDRCNAQTRYSHVGHALDDPLRRHGMPSHKRFCDDCEHKREEIDRALRAYIQNCLDAWEMCAAQPQAPRFWDEP